MEGLIPHSFFSLMMLVVDGVDHSLFFLFLFFVFFSSGSFTGGFIIFIGGVGVSSLLAGALAEPLGQLGLGPLEPFIVLLLPEGLEVFSTDDFPATLVQLSPVLVSPGVGPTLVFGVHADLGRIFASEGLGVKALLHGLLPQLLLLSFLQLFQVIVLPLLSFFEIVFLSLEPDNGVPKLLGFVHEFIGLHGLDVKGFEADGQRDFLLFLKLFFGLGHFTAGILNVGHASSGFGSTALATLACGLLLLLL